MTLTALSLGSLASCQVGVDELPVAAPGPVEFRSGVTAIAVDVIADEQACFTLKYACDDPEYVEVAIDSDVKMSWRRPDFSDGIGVGLAPPEFCQPTYELAAGSHAFALTAECGGLSTTASVTAVTALPSFRIARLAADQTTYTVGDEVLLELDVTGTGLGVTADFSAVDSTYTTGGESVVAISAGKYQIRRTLGTGNVRPSGDYMVTVTVTKGAAAKAFQVPIRWLPLGYPRVALASATFNPVGAWTRASASTTTVSSVTHLATPSQSAVTPELFAAPGDDAGGRPFTLTFQTDAAIGGTIGIEMQDTDRNGSFFARYHATASSTTANVYTVSGLLQDNPVPYRQANPNLRFRVVLPGGAASPWFNNTFAWVYDQGEVTVLGTVSYDYNDCVPDTSINLVNSPQYFGALCKKTTRPAKHVMVELLSGCNQSKRTSAGADGGFILSLPDSCANEPYSIRVHAVTANVPGRRVAIGGWIGPAIDELSELTDDPHDYQVHWAEVGVLNAPFGDSINGMGNLLINWNTHEAMAGSAHIIENMRTGLDYFANFVDPHDLAAINVSWSPEGPDLEGVNAFVPMVHPSLFHFRPNATNFFVTAHELSHYIHSNFMDDAKEYGSFSEPMANINASMIMRSPWLSGFPTSVMENMDFNGTFTEDVGGPGIDGFRQADLKFFATNAEYEDCDNRSECCALDPANIPMCVLGAQGWIWRIFQDLHDGAGGEPGNDFFPSGGGAVQDFGNFDQVDGGGGSADALTHDLADVMFHYLGGINLPTNPDREDRGLDKTDIVDVLDGMVCRGHMPLMSASSLLWDAMNFDYDFLGPASCD